MIAIEGNRIEDVQGKETLEIGTEPGAADLRQLDVKGHRTTTISGTVGRSGSLVILSVPLNPTFNLTDPATGLSATIWINGTANASAPVNPPGANYLDIANRVIQPGQSAFTIAATRASSMVS